jgi:hypothetical protein
VADVRIVGNVPDPNKRETDVPPKGDPEAAAFTVAANDLLSSLPVQRTLAQSRKTNTTTGVNLTELGAGVFPGAPRIPGLVTLAGVPGLGAAERAERADGSSPNKAIPLNGPEAVRVLTRDEIISGLKPEAFVAAISGTIGPQELPGWEALFAGRGSDAQIKYLAAVLIPVDVPNDVSSVSLRPLDSTLFLSVTLPGQQPLILTTKLKDLNFEAGRPIYNKRIANGSGLFFSNERIGATLTGVDAVGSVNWGILKRVGNVGSVTEKARKVVTQVTRGLQGRQLALGLAAAPETEGGSLVAGAAGAAATEVLRQAIFRSMGKADIYLGGAWRSSASTGINFDGQATLQVQRGELRNKWIVFNLADIPGALFEVPDFEQPNRQRLLDMRMSQEAVDILAPALTKHDVKPLLDQTADYLHVSTGEVVEWFDRLAKNDPAWLSWFVNHGLRRIEPVSGDNYSKDLTSRDYIRGAMLQTIADMDRYTALHRHPLPGSHWKIEDGRLVPAEGAKVIATPPERIAPPVPEIVPPPVAPQPAPVPVLPAPPVRGTQYAVKPPRSASLQPNPGESGPPVDFLPVGRFVNATGEQRYVNGSRWLQVTAGRSTGWVLADSLVEHTQGAQDRNGRRYNPGLERSREFERWTVRQGDSLWAMARRKGLLNHYGDIVSDNRHIPDVDRWVRPGDRIYVRKVYYQSRRK